MISLTSFILVDLQVVLRTLERHEGTWLAPINGISTAEILYGLYDREDVLPEIHRKSTVEKY